MPSTLHKRRLNRRKKRKAARLERRLLHFETVLAARRNYCPSCDRYASILCHCDHCGRPLDVGAACVCNVADDGENYGFEDDR